MARITIEKLAVMMNNGFEETQKVIIESVSREINRLDEKINGVETKLDKVGDRLERVESKVDRALHVEYVNLEGRVKKIEKRDK